MAQAQGALEKKKKKEITHGGPHPPQAGETWRNGKSRMFCRTAGTWDEKEAVIRALVALARWQHKGGEQTAREPAAPAQAPGEALRAVCTSHATDAIHFSLVERGTRMFLA